MAPQFSDLAAIEVESGVTESAAPFCRVRCVADNGETILLGQLPPEVLRTQAMQFLAVAEAAEQEAAVFRLMRDLELPEELAAQIVRNIRDNRSGGDPWP